MLTRELQPGGEVTDLTPDPDIDVTRHSNGNYSVRYATTRTDLPNSYVVRRMEAHRFADLDPEINVQAGDIGLRMEAEGSKFTMTEGSSHVRHRALAATILRDGVLYLLLRPGTTPENIQDVLAKVATRDITSRQ